MGYTGLSAALLRQATYTTSRLGIYTWLFEKFSTDGKAPGFFMKAAMGMAAGGSAAFVGTPAEVALIRMTSDGSLPVDKRRNYSSVFNALARIYREEGLATLWRGATPTMTRAMVVNGAQLATYSQAKQVIPVAYMHPRLHQGRHLLPLCGVHDLGPGHHHRLDAGGHHEDAATVHEVRRRGSRVQGSRGCAGTGGEEGRLLLPVEGLHSILLPAGAPHRHHLHTFGTDEHCLQAARARHQGRQRGAVRNPRHARDFTLYLIDLSYRRINTQ